MVLSNPTSPRMGIISKSLLTFERFSVALLKVVNSDNSDMSFTISFDIVLSLRI